MESQSRDCALGWLRRLIGIAVWTLAICIGARLRVPLGDVPFTLQTLAVGLAGMTGGMLVGGGAALVYLTAVLAGAPVLAGGRSVSFDDFVFLPTAGYIVGFVPAAAFGGWIARKVRRGSAGFADALMCASVAHVIVLGVGVPWYSSIAGWHAGFANGLWPLLPGLAVKSLIVAGLVVVLGRSRDAIGSEWE